MEHGTWNMVKYSVRDIEMIVRQEHLLNWFGEETNDQEQALLQLTVVMTTLHWTGINHN
jgi:hypothetical protein